MLDETMHFHKEEGKNYPPLPKGIYQAELLDLQTKEATGKYAKPGEKNIVYQFTLLSGKDKDGGDLRGRNVWENFGDTRLYIGKKGKNNMYRIVEAFIGRELTQEEEANGISAKQINGFLGSQILLSIEPKKSEDGSKTFDKIVDYFAVQARINSLTEEEKEKARVKKDNKENEEITHRAGVPITPAEHMQAGMQRVNNEDVYIDVNSIPF